MVEYNNLDPYNPFERGFIFAFGLKKDPENDRYFDKSKFSLDFIEEKVVDGEKTINRTAVPFELCSKSSKTEFSNANGFKDYNMYFSMGQSWQIKHLKVTGLITRRLTFRSD